MDKGRFSTPQQYEAALRSEQYSGHEPIDPKAAGMCLQDEVVRQGDNPNTTGACLLAPKCDYANNKISGVSGFCLKQAVGVEIK